MVLLDYQIGERTGLDVLVDAKAAGYGGPVIMLTGHGDEDIAVEALQAGAADYLRKGSMTRKSLRRAIGNAIEKNMLQMALTEHRSELEEANRSLTERNSEIRRFYQTLSHEMKTPLTVAREFIAMVTDGLLGRVTDAQTDSLRVALESCDQMTVLINDLLDVTRAETGKLQLQRRILAPGPIIRKLVASVRPLAESTALTLELDESDRCADVFADEARVVQVISNLVRNAIKFTPEGGVVTVRVGTDQSEAGFVRISVIDNGVGIAEGDVTQVFGRLFQSDEELALEKGGLGLGLHLCQQLVELHGGRIWCESRLGEGSAFHFLLPTASTTRTEVSLGEDMVSG